MNNIRRALKVASVITYEVNQKALDTRFADQPDRPITPAEYQEAIRRAGQGQQAAKLAYDEKRAEDDKRVIMMSDAWCIFRGNVITDSERRRSLVPVEADR